MRVKQSSRNGIDLIVAEMAQTLNIRQDKPSQHVMIDELVRISRRNGKELIVAEMAETLNIHQDKHSQRY